MPPVGAISRCARDLPSDQRGPDNVSNSSQNAAAPPRVGERPSVSSLVESPGRDSTPVAKEDPTLLAGVCGLRPRKWSGEWGPRCGWPPRVHARAFGVQVRSRGGCSGGGTHCGKAADPVPLSKRMMLFAAGESFLAKSWFVSPWGGSALWL